MVSPLLSDLSISCSYLRGNLKAQVYNANPPRKLKSSKSIAIRNEIPEMFYKSANYYGVLIVHKGILEMEGVKAQQLG